MSKLITNTIRHTGASSDNVTLTSDGKIVGVNQASPTVGYGCDASVHVHSDLTSGTRGAALHLTTNSSGATAGDGLRVSLIDTDAAIDNRESGMISVNTAGTERLRVHSGGDVEVKTGSLIIGTSGEGIDFAATGGPVSGTGSSERLEDYEEGTFTPTLITGNNGYRFQYGHYVKVGKMVHVSCWIEVSAACSSGNLGMSGLPFTSTTIDTNNHVTILGSCYSNRCSLGDNALWYLAANSSTAYCYAVDSNAANGTTLLDVNNLSQANASAIMLSGTFRTT